jgi:putative ABC transport system permease protein
MGASRRQVTRSVLLEALMVAIIGSTLGLLVGVALATALRALFNSFGLDTSSTPLQLTPRTVLVSYVVGVIVTLFAAYLPARRASRIAPVAAMRDDIALPETSLRRRLAVGVGLTLLGAGLMTVGLIGEGGQGASLVGLGVFSVLIAVALMSPMLGRPVLLALGAVYQRLFGTVGTLATQNSLRNPRRTAATASALMIGLALVSTIAVLGASTNRSIEASVQEQFTTDFLISSPTFTAFSTSIADDAEALPETGEVIRMQGLLVDVDGDDLFATAADPAQVAASYALEVQDGRLDAGEGEVAISSSSAEDRSWAVGDTVSLEFPAGEEEAEVVGVYDDSEVVGDALLPFSTIKAAQIPRQDLLVGIDAADGVDAAALGAELDGLVEDLPSVTVQDQEEFTDAQRAQVNQLLYLIYGLLGLAIVIASRSASSSARARWAC